MFSLILVIMVICVIVNVIGGITGISSYHSDGDDHFNQFNQFQRDMQQQQFDEMNRHCMEESIKSVTPFEMGGYDMTQGNSWNNNDFGGMF